MVGVAQLVRAPGCGLGGRGFKTHHSPHKSILQSKNNFLLILGILPDQTGYNITIDILLVI